MNEEPQIPPSYFERLKLIKQGLLPKEAIKKKPKAIPKISERKKAEDKALKEAGMAKPASKLELDKWYFGIQHEHFYLDGCAICSECGAFIPSQFARHAIAHLLPKKLFKSVATHPDNYLILGAGCGCHEKTHRIDKFIQMKIWPEAARRIKILLPLLPIDELRHVSNQLLTALDNTITK